MVKAKDAFRTISEVSEWLDTPTHVLRFWESKFSQIKPVKRAGGRRYYRPDDMALLGGIKSLLHEQGMTIKGTQKLLREKGVKHVATLGLQPNGDDDSAPVSDPTTQIAEVSATSKAEPVSWGEETRKENIAEATPEKVNPTINVPDLPAEYPAAPARFFGAYNLARRDTLRVRVTQIAPLVRRLEQVRDRMRLAKI